MTIAQRFTSLLFGVVLCLACVAGLFIFQMGRVFDSANFSNVNIIPSILLLDDASREFGLFRIRLYRYALDSKSEDRGALEKELWDANARMKKSLKDYESMIANDQDHLMLTATNRALAEYTGRIEPIIAAVKGSHRDAVINMLAASRPFADVANEALDTHTHFNRQLGQESAETGVRTKKNAELTMMILGGTLLGIVALLSYLFTHALSSAMKKSSTVANSIARGDLSSKIIVRGDDETVQMLSSLKLMQEGLFATVEEFRNMVETAAIHGDFSIKLNLENKQGYVHDLAKMFNRLSLVTESGLGDSLRLAKAMATGDLSQNVDALHPGRFGELINALRELQAVSIDLELQRWSKEKLADILATVQKSDTLDDFGNLLLARLCPTVGAMQAVLYVDRDETTTQHAVGSYACLPNDQSYAIGESVVGQCAQDMVPLAIVNPTDGALRLKSGLVDTSPGQLVLLPLVQRRFAIGVLEMAFPGPPDAGSRLLLDTLPAALAPALEVLRRNLRTERLAMEIQAQAELLQTQKQDLLKSDSSLRDSITMMNDVLAAATGIAIVGTDLNGDITLFNSGAENLFGWTASEVIGTKQFVNLHTSPETQETTAGLVDTPGGFDVITAHQNIDEARVNRECSFARRDGSHFAGQLMVTPVNGSDNKLRGNLCVVQDITARRELEAGMKQARKAAEEASRMKSDFLANMSHEIRTPMNGILGMTHLALRSELTSRQREYLRKIQISGAHLLRIINDILDISKIEAGKLAIESTEFELETALAGVVNLVANKASEKGLELVLDVAGDVPVNLIGDSLRLGQVLINYANNAVKFTEHGEIDILVKVRERTEDSVLLWFGVRDTGIGISPEEASLLFKAFSQADPTTTRKFGGTGLGLAISRRLAKLMGGEAGLESKPGAGSTFWFTARFALGRPDKRALLPAPDLRGRHVLVVDDNDNARQVMSEMLGNMSFKVDAVGSGRDAIAAIARTDGESQPYELVIMDWHMPLMNGIDACRKIQSLQLAAPPRMLLVTAYGREEVFHQAEDIGIRDILIKPMSASTLFDTVIRILQPVSGSAAEISTTPFSSPSALDAISGARILVVEDNEINQDVILELLRHAHFTVDLAENGRVALSHLQTMEYDLVLMDMQMPVMGGIEATKELRRIRGLEHLPVVAMTANALASDRQICFEAGMCDFVSKPIEPDLLWDALIKWIPPRRAVEPVSMATAAADAPKAAFELNVPGIDSNAALRRMLGRTDIYLRTLRAFCEQQDGTAKAMCQALDANDPVTAHRLVHTLKGLAGSIGADSLASQAAEVERTISTHQPRAKIDVGIISLEAAVRQLIAAVGPWLPPEEAPPVDSNSASIDEFEQLLAASDPESLSWLLRNAAALRGQLQDAGIKEIEKAVRNFDLDQALQLVQQARNQERKS